MLSLSPRHDLFRFNFPKDFLPEEVEKKYSIILTKNPGVITKPIDYLNESIQSISFPGISSVTVGQDQHSANPNPRILGKINLSPKHEVTYQASTNPLENIDKEFKISFRMNQGFYNYFMLYETMFYQICKDKDGEHHPVFRIELLDETGQIISVIKYFDVLMDSIDGLDFDFNKISRESDTFDVGFKFNNIDFDLNIENKIL